MDSNGSGPEVAAEPGVARDGSPLAAVPDPTEEGGSIEQQAETTVDEVMPPMEGDKQLTLSGLGNVGRTPVQSTVSVQSASRPIDGMLEPGQEVHVIVTALPAKFEYVPKREGGDVKRWELRQSVAPVHMERITAEELQWLHERRAERLEEVPA